MIRSPFLFRDIVQQPVEALRFQHNLLQHIGVVGAKLPIAREFRFEQPCQSEQYHPRATILRSNTSGRITDTPYKFRAGRCESLTRPALSDV